MKKFVFAVGSSFLLVLLAILVSGQGIQLKEKAVAYKFPPHINAVTQEPTAMAIQLVLTGRNFPPKNVGNVWRAIRLITAGEGGITAPKASVYYAGATGNWTSTRIDDLLHYTIPAARKYRVGLVQYVAPGPPERTLISNEVEYFLLMHLDHVVPNPVPSNIKEIEVFTANLVGTQGAKIVKIGNQQAQVTQWGAAAAPGNFKVNIPITLAIPGVYDIYVEENGVPVSRKIPVQLLQGVPIHK
jgi:hypothetical protein